MSAENIIKQYVRRYNRQIKQTLAGGEQYVLDNGWKVTANPCLDGKYPGCWYLSITYPDGGKETMVVDKDGNVKN